MEILEDHAQFFTASILDHKRLLSDDKYKQIIADSLSFLTKNKRVYVYAFVIMSNHIHIIWQAREGHFLKNVQRDFLKFTAQQFRFDLIENDPVYLNEFEVNLKDRKYQFWQRSSLSIPVYTPKIFEQKVRYIHDNPVKAGLVKLPEEFKYSSAAFYLKGDTHWNFLKHHDGHGL